jgi:TPR repeat protein
MHLSRQVHFSKHIVHVEQSRSLVRRLWSAPSLAPYRHAIEEVRKKERETIIAPNPHVSSFGCACLGARPSQPSALSTGVFNRLLGHAMTDASLSATTAFAAPRIVVRRRHASIEELRTLLARNPRQAAISIRDAAHAGMTGAQIAYGQMLLDGSHVERNVAQACSWFAKAAESNDLDALNMLGRCHENGWGVLPDFDRAAGYFEQAANKGHVWAKVNLAQILMRKGRPEDRARCFALFQEAADAGNLKAMNSLARFLEEGWAGVPDPDGATALYTRAAEAGDHWAQFNLATILLRREDPSEATRWLKSAVAISDNGFRRRVAPMLLSQPQQAIRQTGLEALALCADAGDPTDLYAYGVALVEGVDGQPDPKRGFMILERAAVLGHTGAAHRLAGLTFARPSRATRLLEGLVNVLGRAVAISPARRLRDSNRGTP